LLAVGQKGTYKNTHIATTYTLLCNAIEGFVLMKEKKALCSNIIAFKFVHMDKRPREVIRTKLY